MTFNLREHFIHIQLYKGAIPGSFHRFHSALLRYLCGVLPPVTSNFNSLVLKTEYESSSLKILTCTKRAHSDLSCMGNYAKIARAPTRAEMMAMAGAAALAPLEIPAAACAVLRAAAPLVPHFALTVLNKYELATAHSESSTSNSQFESVQVVAEAVAGPQVVDPVIYKAPIMPLTPAGQSAVVPVASAVAMVGKQFVPSALQTHVVSAVHVASTVIAPQAAPGVDDINAFLPAI